MPLHRDDPKSVGGYRLIDRLGAGGMGVVYRGRSRSGREVAVKVVHAQYAEDPVFRTRFRQEIAAVRKVSGAFTAPVVDADPDAVRPWMATLYVPGRSLAARIRDTGPLPDAELRRLALGLVEALRDIHRAGVVHRDLKPANVLIADDGPRVIDFGISRAAENSTLTETGQMIGTPPFMSPEQLTDARSVGPSSDVFSLGALLVHTSTGRGPFDADSPYLTAYRVVHDEPVLDGVRQPLRAIVERCLAKDAARRPGLDELAAEFAMMSPEAADDSATVSLRSDAAAARTQPDPHPVLVPAPSGPADRRRRHRGRLLWTTTGTVGALALGLTAYLLVGPGRTDDSAEPRADRAAASRWVALPAGWKPWRTTVFETASRGAPGPAGLPDVAGEPTCLTHEDAVYCTGEGVHPVRLDARTGRTVWRADVTEADVTRYSGELLGIRDGRMLVRQVVSTDAPVLDPVDVYAFDTETGEAAWHRRVNDENVNPTVTGGLLIASDDSRTVTARSPRTGAELWTAELPADRYCSFLAGGTGVHANCILSQEEPTDNVLLSLDPADGSASRSKAPSESGVLGELDGRLVIMKWAQPEDSTALADTYESILLVDPDTGARTTVPLAGKYEGEPTLSHGTLWFVSRSGLVTAVSPRTGKQLWQTRTSLEQPGPVTYDSRTRTLYLASISGRVAALDVRKGTSLWETLPRAGVSDGSVPVPQVLLHRGALIVATPDGTVFSVDPAHPDREPVSG